MTSLARPALKFELNTQHRSNTMNSVHYLLHYNSRALLPELLFTWSTLFCTFCLFAVAWRWACISFQSWKFAHQNALFSEFCTYLNWNLTIVKLDRYLSTVTRKCINLFLFFGLHYTFSVKFFFSLSDCLFHLFRFRAVQVLIAA